MTVTDSVWMSVSRYISALEAPSNLIKIEVQSSIVSKTLYYNKLGKHLPVQEYRLFRADVVEVLRHLHTATKISTEQ